MDTPEANLWMVRFAAVTAIFTLGLLIAAFLQLRAANKQVEAANKQVLAAESQAKSAEDMARTEAVLTKVTEQQFQLQRTIEQARAQVDVRVRMRSDKSAMLWVDIANMGTNGVWVAEMMITFYRANTTEGEAVFETVDLLIRPFETTRHRIMLALQRLETKIRELGEGTIHARVIFETDGKAEFSSDSPTYELRLGSGGQVMRFRKQIHYKTID